MSALLLCLFALLLAYRSYCAAQRAGIWSWADFFIVIGLILAFTGCVIAPLLVLPGLAGEPALLVALLLTAIVLFIVLLLYVMRRRKAHRLAAGAHRSAGSRAPDALIRPRP